jgi:hypothetical protein
MFSGCFGKSMKGIGINSGCKIKFLKQSNNNIKQTGNLLMKKYLLPFLCFILALSAGGPARADDYSITSVLSLPYGIFDTLNSSGSATFTNAEIGVREWNQGATVAGTTPAYPVMQKQKIAVYGGTNFSGNTNIINGTLQIEGPDPLDNTKTAVFELTNVNLGRYAYFSAGGPVSIGTAAVRYFGISGVLEISNPSNPVVIKATNIYAGALKYLKRNRSVTGANYADGSLAKWTSIIKKAAAADPNTYGAWEAGSGSDTDTWGNNDIENTCSGSSPEPRTDVRQLPADPDTAINTNGAGGVTITRILGRRECRYMGNNTCDYDSDYDFNISTSGRIFNAIPGASQPYKPATSCGFTYAYFQSKYGDYFADGVNPKIDSASICSESALCNSVACTQEKSCIIDGDDSTGANEYTSGWQALSTVAGNNKQPGVVRASKDASGCGRTGWPEHTGLECKNAWDERWFTVVTCGVGSGGPTVYKVARYQKRTVECATAGTGNLDGTFLVLDK